MSNPALYSSFLTPSHLTLLSSHPIQASSSSLQTESESIALLEKQEEDEQEELPRFHVVFYNDEFTTMEFVIAVLHKVFNYDIADAYDKTMEIHEQNKAIVATYLFEIAETKQSQVLELAEKAEFPLRCELEPESSKPSFKMK